VGNDYGFEQVFVRQVRALGRKGDIAFALSTSGNSPNVLRATEAAEELGMVTIGLTGRDGGRLASRVRYNLNVPHKLSARIQEVHIMIGHLLCQLTDENMKGL
jgi:D-sedoheptulose 7-phosphate isomerase